MAQLQPYVNGIAGSPVNSLTVPVAAVSGSDLRTVGVTIGAPQAHIALLVF
jgi:hypothetical protein